MQNSNNTAIYLSKARLYEELSLKAREIGLNFGSPNYRMDSLKLVMEVCINPQIIYIDFEDAIICGILYKGRNCTTIGLNSRRSHLGKNFDCMHELIHYWFHGAEYFWCDQDQKNHLEWQANEGAAQFLMPYQSFIPNYSHLHDELYERLPPEAAHDAVIARLSAQYLVGETAVKYRLNGLQNEIKQYINGIPIDEIKITSRTQKRRL
ncbi:MAG: ImmA/IrrE family metallo-endopeptidase [Defluviitaleaceae bacterium]|nr:ImmA/IrrE family metallo-endopeptidase [Defluviitaleaceae bacterium]